GTTMGSWGSLVGSLLVGVNGLASVLVAFVPTDSIDSRADAQSLSTAGTIHVALAVVAFLCIILGMFVLTRTFMQKACWQRFSRWLMLLPAGALSLFFVQTQGPVVGLMQRLLVSVIAIWLILVAFKVCSFAAYRNAA